MASSKEYLHFILEQLSDLDDISYRSMMGEYILYCPNCLSSLHVDEEPGDRASDCGGIMEPVAVWVRKGGEWAIIHRCKRCGKLSSNRVAADDNPMKLMSIAMKPLCAPPFPLDYLEKMTALMGGDGRMR